MPITINIPGRKPAEHAPMVVPSVHLNGTSKDELITQLVAVDHAIEKAIAAIRRAMPHNRDYYVQPDPDAGIKARMAFDDRLITLSQLRADFSELCYAIYDQHTNRRG